MTKRTTTCLPLCAGSGRTRERKMADPILGYFLAPPFEEYLFIRRRLKKIPFNPAIMHIYKLPHPRLA
jgi:hypothetical protein